MQLNDYKNIVVNQLGIENFMIDLQNFELLGGVDMFLAYLSIPRSIKIDFDGNQETADESFFVYILSSDLAGEYLIKERKNKGNSLIFHCAATHKFNIDFVQGFNGILIGFQFKYEHVKAYLNNSPLNAFTNLSTEFPLIDYQVGQLVADLKKTHIEKSKLIHSIFFMMLELLAEPSQTSIENVRIEEIKKLSAENSKLSFIELSKAAGMSQSQLKRKFKVHEGKTLREFTHDSKMKMSLDLIKQNHSVKEVSNRLGYTSQNSFSRAFKTYFGFPPTDVKKQKD